MQVTIKDIEINFNFSIGSLTEIVQYKKFYEPHDKVTLTQYLSRVDNEDYLIDNLCDLIFYAHAIKYRNQGRQPVLTYSDVTEWVFMNLNTFQHVVNKYTDSLPKPEVKQDVVVKKKRGRKPTLKN